MTEPFNKFRSMFEAITGIPMERAVKAHVDGKEDELLHEISENARKTMRPDELSPELVNMIREQAADARRGMPVNLSDKIKNPTCKYCQDYEFGPRHDGSKDCKSGSIASGGTNAHCSCDTCF